MPHPAQPIGPVCHRWDYQAKRCAETIDVLRVDGTQAAHYMAKLAVDADGAPRAYHPDDRRPPDNGAHAFDWLANISSSDLHGVQGQDGIGPARGFYVSGTAIGNPHYPENDTRRYVDASTIPYIVLPKSTFPTGAGGVHDGCLVFVADSRSGHATGAIFADIGRAIGEGSIALALRLGLTPFSRTYFPKVVGFDERRFFHLVFPTVTIAPPWPVADIQSRALAAFDSWGGEDQLRYLYPNFPKLLPPVESSADSVDGADRTEESAKATM